MSNIYLKVFLFVHFILGFGVDQIKKKKKIEINIYFLWKTDLPPDQQFKYPDEDRRRPQVPRRDDKPLMGLKTSKNFITTNAVQNITSVPKQPPKIYVDTRGGNKNLLEPSGLEPVYTNKKVFIYISIFWQTDRWWCRRFNFLKI